MAMRGIIKPGGRRKGSGSKRQPVADKIARGRKVQVLEIPVVPCADLPEAVDIEIGRGPNGLEMPPPDEYLSLKQRDGSETGAAKLYGEAWRWLVARRCEKLVNPRMIEAYAQSLARYIQCERGLSEFGVLGKHPTTGAVVPSPYVEVGQRYLRQAQQVWEAIELIVRDNCLVPYEGGTEADAMEGMIRDSLKGKKRKI